jgi:excisionase family DNA binding protein
MSAPAPRSPLAFRVPEFAQSLGVSKAHIYNMIKRGELRAVKIGGATRIPASEVQRLLDEEVVA